MSRSLRRLSAAVLALVLLIAACGAGEDTTVASTQAESPNTAPFGRTVQIGDAISVHYTGTLDNGEEFDSSRNGSPLSFTVGAGGMIAGFDTTVRGMTIGEIKTVRLEPSEAYGERDETAMLSVSLEQLPEGVAGGDRLVSGSGQQVVVLEVGETEALLDLNSYLAGEALTFEIELVSFDN